MNNQILSRSTVDGAQESPGAARLGQRGGRWRSAKLQRVFCVLIVIASTLMLIGCPGGDDDNDDDSEDITGGVARDFRNVMPLVNNRSVNFPNGVMGTTGSSTTLTVRDINTCTDATDCRGTFTLDGDGVDTDGEGDSGGETSCFFDFTAASSDPLDRERILCQTCNLEVVSGFETEECVVKVGEPTVCLVRWLLAADPDADDPAASTSFQVTFEIDSNGNFVADGVVLIEEDDD